MAAAKAGLVFCSVGVVPVEIAGGGLWDERYY
jgi:hypothetical protein